MWGLGLILFQTVEHSGSILEKIFLSKLVLRPQKNSCVKKNALIDGWLRMGLLPPLGNFADISYLVEN